MRKSEIGNKTFLQAEKLRLAAFKRHSSYFSPAAREDGIYKGKPRPFCLPQECAEQNLFSPIRQPSMAYFSASKIKWHDQQHGGPSNHLCDSQVCCVNFLSPFADKPNALKSLLLPIFPEIDHMLPMEKSGQHVAFEWIGKENYLKEKIRLGGERTRGANFTSADAAVRFIHKDGKCQVVLIEWKYTESYGGNYLKIAASGTDRSAIYRHLFERPDFPLKRNLLPDFDALFYEPFYQFFRQQMLAHEMERARELEAEIVGLLHIAPAQNKEFQRVTSPKLCSLDKTATKVWKRLQQRPDRFISIGTEGLFGNFAIREFPELNDWWDYINARYVWLRSPGLNS